MTDPGKLSQQRERGARAKQLLEDELINEFFDKCEAAAVRAWKESEPGDNLLRDRAYYRLQALEDLKFCFSKTIEEGKFAHKELLRIDEEKRTDHGGRT